MLSAALRDLQWRRRRFLIAILGTAVVFALTLVLTGLAHGFRAEAQRTVAVLGFDTFLIPAGAVGPFLGTSPFPSTSPVTAVDGGVPLVYGATTVDQNGMRRNANVFGAPAGGPGVPPVLSGKAPVQPDEAAVTSTLHRPVGDRLEIGSSTVRIVGLVGDLTALAGQPDIYLTTEGAQRLIFGGQPLISSVGVHGTPAAIPENFRAIDRQGAVDDLLRPTASAASAITQIAIMLWIVAALIVGSVIYLSALERTRDFAVFKAVGISTRSVLAGLAVQAVVVAVIAAVLGGLLSLVMAPIFPMTVVIPASAYLLLPVIAIAIGLLASMAGLRRAVTVDPALAFGGP
jgi:putative ABC transport system permease protein